MRVVVGCTVRNRIRVQSRPNQIPAPGYIIDESEYDFTFEYAGPDVEVVTILLNDGKAIDNAVIRGSGKLIKADADGNRLAGAVFYLYTENGTLLGEFTTPANGEILIEGLSYGRYYWVEKSAPSGFQYDGTPHWFSISYDGQTAEVTAVNHRPDIPQTGDDTNLTLWTILGSAALVIFAGGVAYLVLDRKKKKRK